MSEQDTLITKLIERQGDASDREFARRLGISHGRWCQIVAGEPVGLEFLRSVVWLYPDLGLIATGLLFVKPRKLREAQS